MERLIASYKKDRRELSKAINRLEKEALTYDKDDWHRDDCKGRANNLTWLVGNLDYSIAWMEYRYVETDKAQDHRYHQSFPVDPFTMEKYMQPQDVQIRHLGRADLNRIHEALSILSAREKECYTMHIGEMFNEYEIAEQLGIRRDTVREYLERAQNKLKQYRVMPKQTSLDLVV